MQKRNIDFIPTLFQTLHKKFMEQHERILNSYGLTKRHIPYIMILTNKVEGLTQHEMCTILHFDKAHTSRTINDLVEHGFVSRDSDTGYKNKYYISVSGQQVAKTIKKDNQAIIERVLGALTEDELNEFEQIIKKITDAI